MTTFDTFQEQLKNAFIPEVRALLETHKVPVVVYHASNETVDQAHIGHLTTINLPHDATAEVQTNLPKQIEAQLDNLLIAIIGSIREGSDNPENEQFTLAFVVTPALIKFEGNYNRTPFLYEMPILQPAPPEALPHDPAVIHALEQEALAQKAAKAAEPAEAPPSATPETPAA